MNGAAPSGAQALTPWLTAYLNNLAGKPPGGFPLTFGELWGTPASGADRGINLEMMTTCLSHGRPYRLPFRDDHDVRENRQFYFRAEQFRCLFPEHVVTWLEQHPRLLSDDKDSRQREQGLRQAGYLPLPEPRDLPVVVAVRMSLSFPLLLTAVPLHAIDFTRTDAAATGHPELCWFSDGGISSNFPLHFFDSPLPRWPTFGIDLTEKHPDHAAGFYMPKQNSAGIAERWSRFDNGKGGQRLTGFLGVVLSSMKDWADNTQGRLPGFRDRIGQVSLTDDEGGLNLNMPPERIRTLSARGAEAGREFVKRFASDDPGCDLDWNNHRWVRLRSTLAALEEMLLKIERNCADPHFPDAPYDVWIQTTAHQKPPSYPWEPRGDPVAWEKQRKLAEESLAVLRQLAQTITAAINNGTRPLADGAPRPRPELRVRPRI